MGGTFGFGQGIHFPDENLHQVLLNEYVADLDGDGDADSPADLNHDGIITPEEALQILGLSIGFAEIESLEGLEYFTNLENLSCDNNSIAHIPTQHFPLLGRLSASQNPFEQLDLTQNPLLHTLWLSGNMGLNSIDLTNNPELYLLWLHGCPISQIDLTQNTTLNSLNLLDLPLESVELNNNVALESLNIRSNNPNTIELSTLINLKYCDLELPSVTSIDFSQNKKLESLFLVDMTLPIIDMRQNLNLKFLVMDYIITEDLLLDGLESFQGLGIDYSEVSNVDLSSVPNLETALFVDAGLEYLNLQNGNNEAIEFFVSYDNPNLDCILVDDPDYATQVLCEDGIVPKWCIDPHTSYSLDCILSAPDHTNLAISLYPNPSTNYIQLQTEVPLESVHIFDLSGQLVLESSADRIDVRALTAGLYFLSAQTDTSSQTLKFVKR